MVYSSPKTVRENRNSSGERRMMRVASWLVINTVPFSMLPASPLSAAMRCGCVTGSIVSTRTWAHSALILFSVSVTRSRTVLS